MKYKSLYLSALFSLLFTFSSFAQGSSIRFEAGVNFAKMKDVYEVKNIHSVQRAKCGIYFKVPSSSPHLYIELGLLYSGKGFQAKDQKKDFYWDYSSSDTNTIAYEYKVNTLEIPISLTYQFPLKRYGSLFVAVGPYIGYYFSGKDKITSDSSEKTTRISFKYSRKEAFDFGGNLGLLYQFPFRMYLRAQYSIGIPDFLFNNSHYKNRIFSISLGYDLPLKK